MAEGFQSGLQILELLSIRLKFFDSPVDEVGDGAVWNGSDSAANSPKKRDRIQSIFRKC